MNKTLFLALTLGAFALLSSCSGDTIEADGSNPIETRAKLTLVLQDSVSGKTVDGASVTLMSTATTKTSQSGGIVVFEDVRTGDHQIRIDAGTGYAEIFYSTAVGEATNQGVYITRDTSIKVPLYPLTASVVGYLYYEDKDGNKAPVPLGTVVKLQLSNSQFVNRIDSTTTVAGGKYEFNKLPVYAKYSLTATGATIGGIVYNSKQICGNCTSLTPNGTATIEVANFEINNTQSLFVVESYNNVIENADRGKAVVFSFSDTIDASQFRYDMVGLSEINGGELAANVSVSGKTLTLAPVGNWKNSFNVYLKNLKSTNGKSINESYIVNVNLRDLTDVPVEIVSYTDSLDYYDNDITLEWERVEGADSYEIYRKIDGLDQGAYEKINEVPNQHAGDSLIKKEGVYLSKSISGSIKNSKVSFIVQAVNATSKTALNEEKYAITVQDNVAPTVKYLNDADSVVQVYYGGFRDNVGEIPNLFDGSKTLADVLQGLDSSKSCVEIYFDEPIDTTAAAITENAAFNGNGIPRVNVIPKWETCAGVQSHSTLSLNIIVGAGGALTTGRDANYIIKGLKDLSGNALNIQYSSSKTSNVDVLFKFTIPTPPSD